MNGKFILCILLGYRNTRTQALIPTHGDLPSTLLLQWTRYHKRLIAYILVRSHSELQEYKGIGFDPHGVLIALSPGQILIENMTHTTSLSILLPFIESWRKYTEMHPHAWDIYPAYVVCWSIL